MFVIALRFFHTQQELLEKNKNAYLRLNFTKVYVLSLFLRLKISEALLPQSSAKAIAMIIILELHFLLKFVQLADCCLDCLSQLCRLRFLLLRCQLR
jgi:hypothetical protein